MDEPTSGLDPKAASELINILKNLRNEGKSILMCTHDIFRAKGVADKVGVMKKGSLVIQCNRKDILKEDLERIYLNYMVDTHF